MRTRLLATAAAAVFLSLVEAGHAAPAPQIVDARGDALGAQAGTDIESVLFSRTKGGFTVTLTLGAPPVRRPGVLYRVYGNHSVCGGLQMSSSASVLGQNQVTMQCGPENGTVGGAPYTIVYIEPKVVGNTLFWSVRTKSLPTEMRAGTMSELEAFVTVADPVTGILNPADFVAGSAIDHAAGTATFRY